MRRKEGRRSVFSSVPSVRADTKVKGGGPKLVCACTEFLVGSCILKTSLFEINPKWLSALSCNNVAIKPSDEVIDEDVSENDTA